MRRKSIILACILILSTSFSNLAYANTHSHSEYDNLHSREGIVINPLWTYILDVWQTFDISGSGRAEVVATMDIKSAEVDSLKIVSNLQQLKNGSWTTIKSWTDTAASTSVILQGTWYVPKGYSYRVVTNYYAYNGRDIESTNLTSQIVKY